MLEDSSVPVLLTQSKLVEKLTPHTARVICLDSDWEKIAFHSSDNPSSGVKPENLAYVIYTSGSTGKAKGVLIQHRSLVNYTTAAIAEYKISQSDRVLQFSSISFDVSAEEIYTSLTYGATLVLRTDSMLDSVSGFLLKCRNWEITVLALPTAYWHELTARLSQENFVLPPSLRLIIIGGEKALTERWKTWLEYVGQRVRLVNNYGPTEATVGATICELSATNLALRELPIGRPIAEFQKLASCIDVIYHNGALVNHIYPYSALKAANVTATEDILRLASQIKVKPVHFISTLSVFDLSKYSQFEVISESDPLNDSQGGGYAQSKWVAEKLIMIARERGLPVCIYRLGRVTGHSKTGIGNTSDSISIMIKGCIQFGIFPELEMMVEMLPVDFVSQAIIAISQAKSSFGKAFHITTNPAHNQISWNDLTKWIQHFGYSVKQISFLDWHKELIHHINYSPENALHSLLPVLTEESEFQKVEIQFDNQNMLKALSEPRIYCPEINEDLLKIYFSYFLNIGFLSKPEQTNLV